MKRVLRFVAVSDGHVIDRVELLDDGTVRGTGSDHLSEGVIRSRVTFEGERHRYHLRGS